MSDSQTSAPKPGPANPQAEGVEAATPPGGPQRQDDPGVGASESQGSDEGRDDDASASTANDKHAEEAGGHTIPIEDEQPDPGADRPDRGENDLQRENAESSLDQPSEG